MTPAEFNQLRNKVCLRYALSGRHESANRVFRLFPSRW